MFDALEKMFKNDKETDVSLYVCVYVCMRTYVHPCMHMRECVCARVCRCVCVHAFVCVRMRTCVYACLVMFTILQNDLINNLYKGELQDYVKCLEVSVTGFNTDMYNEKGIIYGLQLNFISKYKPSN